MKEPTLLPGRLSSSSAFCLSTPSNSQLDEEESVALRLSAWKRPEPVGRHLPVVDFGDVAGGYVVLLPGLDGADPPPVGLSVHQKEESV